MKQELTIGGTFVASHRPMICGSAEAEGNRYKLYVGRSGTIWLVGISEDQGNAVYVQGGPNSDGFGGRVLTFRLENGCDSISLKGPWHTNPSSLLSDTGIDVRDKFYTFGVVGEGREYPAITKLLWFDTEPVIGSFDRVKQKAQEIANERGQTVFYYMESRGGSSCGAIDPDHKAQIR